MWLVLGGFKLLDIFMSQTWLSKFTSFCLIGWALVGNEGMKQYMVV